METAWEIFRRWLAKKIWPELAKEIEQLTGRLATCHKRMQEMYWDGQAKELAKARIAGLEDALWRSCVALHVCGQTEAARKFCEENGILWNQEAADRWRRPEEEPEPAAALSEGQACGGIIQGPERMVGEASDCLVATLKKGEEPQGFRP